MVRPIERSSNQNTHGTSEARMVRLDGESLNQLFSTLADWNQCLTDLPPDVLDDLPNPGPADWPEPSGP